MTVTNKKTVDANGVVSEKKVRHIIDPKFITPSGSKMAMRYKREYSEELKREIVVEAGEIDFYEFIQASSNGTDLELLKRQAKASGVAPEVLPSAQFGVDTRLFPKDIHELYRLANNATEIFNGLSDVEKAAFKNNKDFIEATLNGTAKDRMAAAYREHLEKTMKSAETVSESENK